MFLRDFELSRIMPEHLKVDHPVPWPIYDEFGKLLMAKGAVLRSERQKEILARVGLFAREANPEPEAEVPQPVRFRRKVNPFNEFDELCLKLEAVFTLMEAEKRPNPGIIKKRVYEICTTLQGLVEYDADALLGAVHLADQFPYHVLHPMQIAVLSELIMDRLQAEQAVRLSVLAAALTCNLAMNPYQQRLHQQRTPLNDQQRRVINRHPLQTRQSLEEAGVDDLLWLELVAQHHEKLDGSGYPLGLSGDQIRREARILALADVYSAMVTPRPYRNPIKHKDSLRDIFTQRGSKFDSKLTLLFLNELGVYPPGVYVRLNNGELAVVIGRTPDPRSPLVASIRKPSGDLFLSPRRRNTGSEQFGIRSACNVNERIKINPATLWGINAIRVNVMPADLSGISDLI
ncbi:HD-GYP domain-containing protein [Marinospirillum alkaliphilum]|uniref:HD-GYP domain, c-di-GMP phosphodiesterase class II (Or its inactivated variant) n=1 Tax=Marinospirillum alkaliphilum DSM 21637 TaxID=1122209 RepID=A0A1K1W9H7_9GAMM|nr:HD domain-containing phosphohydrolase [Marinospirillum alkaliphilum]SFX33660.1 HD-GYP domain, c-di-GMP phosphodiesterase class II (or its inactivated variant) [Marinospirillum alkaliphilum DSM 21637]